MNKKTFMAAIAISVLIFSLVGVQLVKLSEANFHFSGPVIVINSPANGATYNSSDVLVDLMIILTDGTNKYSPTFATCRLDEGSSINITLLNPRHNNQWFGNATFNNASQASHTLNVEVHIVSWLFPGQEGKSNANSTFNVDLSTPSPAPTSSPTQQPAVSILYPLNNSFFNVSIGGVNYQLIYETNSSLSWVGYSIGGNGYSIDGRGNGNVTVSGNGTWVHDFGTNGNHTLTLYANDTAGNWATPQTVTYLVNFYPDYTPPSSSSPTIEPTPSPSVAEFPNWIILPLTAVAATMIVYFKKHKRT